MNLNFANILDAGKNILKQSAIFGKKNAPILLTGSSIAIGWFAVYLFWKESRNAEIRIAYDRKVLNEQNGIDPESREALDIPKKEKIVTYLGYCWMSLVLGIASSGLAIAGQKVSLDRLAEAYVMMQFFSDKSDKNEKIADKMSEMLGEKKAESAKQQVREEEFTDEEIWNAWKKAGGKGNTLVEDHVMHYIKKMDLGDLEAGVMKANDELRRRYAIEKEKRLKLVKKKRESDPFYVNGDVSFINALRNSDEDNAYFGDLYAELDLGDFLKFIGLVPDDSVDIRIGELLKFNYYGPPENGDKDYNPIRWSQIHKNYNHTLPNGETITITILDYLHLLSPTYELMERNPL